MALELPALSVFMSACARSGSDLKGALSRLPADFSPQEVRFDALPLDTLAELLIHLEQTARLQPFALAVADAFHFDGEPAATTFLTSADTLREALRLIDWIPSLIHPAIVFQPGPTDTEEAYLHIGIHDPTGAHTDLPVFVEMIMAVMWRCYHMIAPQSFARPRLAFAHAPRADVAEYQRYFGEAPAFEQPANTITLPAAELDTPLPGHMPQAHVRAEQRIRQLVGQVDETQPLRPQVEALLRDQRHLLAEGMDAVAETLHLHPRTLQRRLRAEGCRYSDVLAALRHDLACQLLRDDTMGVEAIGEALGFSDRRSFTQAFRQWQGQTPSAYRAACKKG